MAVTPVTPVPGQNLSVTTGGTAVQVVPGSPNGGFIQNPWSAADQGISTAEVLYVDSLNSPSSTDGSGWGTTVALQPGMSYDIIPGQTTVTRVNAATSGHRFTAVWY
jgi:hypothetical protein